MADRRIRVKRGVEKPLKLKRLALGTLIMIEKYEEPLTLLQRVAYVARYRTTNTVDPDGNEDFYVECERFCDGVLVDCPTDEIAPISREVLVLLQAKIKGMGKAVSDALKGIDPAKVTTPSREPMPVDASGWAVEDVAVTPPEYNNGDEFAGYLRRALLAATPISRREATPEPVEEDPAPARIRRRHAGPDLMAEDEEVQEIEEESPYVRRRIR